MGATKRFLNFVREKLVDTKEEPQRDTELSRGASEDVNIDYGSGRVSMKKLEFYMYHDPITFSGLQMKAASIWGKGMYILSENEEAQEICDKITKLPNFKEYVVNCCFQTFGYGDSYLENIWDDTKNKKGKITKEGENIIGFGITDPKTIIPVWDKKGYIEGYKQRIQGTVKVELVPRKITHFKFFSIADNVRGIGLVEPLASTIESMMIAREATKTLIFRHGTPFVHMKKKGASPKDIPKMAKVASQIDIKKSFASGDKYDFEFHTPGTGYNIEPHINLIEDTMAGGFGIIKPVLFRAGEKMNLATLSKLSEFHLFDIQLYQEKVSSIIENQIFKPVMEAHGFFEEGEVLIPQVVWEPLTEKEDADVVKNDTAYIKLYTEAVSRGYVSEEEAKKLIRERLGIEEE